MDNRNTESGHPSPPFAFPHCLFAWQAGWVPATAGGGLDKPTWRLNPQYDLEIQQRMRLLLQLRVDRCVSERESECVLQLQRHL